MNIKLLFTLTTCISATLSYGQCLETVYKGEGTFYGYTGGGNCSFPNPYSSLNSAALNAPQYGNSELCGACAEVTGPRGTVILSIEDQCPECKLGDLDLEQDAFPLIADPIAGRVPISWKIIPCPVTGAIAFQFKEGSSQYWAGIQVRNHRFPINKFEYKNSNNSYIALQRESYNYFIASSGMGPEPYNFRITDILGQILEIKNIPFSATAPINGDQQFHACNVTSVQDENNAFKVQVYPNPSFEQTRFILNEESFNLNLELYDLFGRILEKIILTAQATHKIELPSKGTYLLKLANPQGQTRFEKLVRY